MSGELYTSIEKFNSDPINAGNDSKSLNLLFEYTKFHIGVYLTLSATYITLASLKINSEFIISVNPMFLWAALSFTLLAGLAGGVIVSSITQMESIKTSDFFRCSIGPWSWSGLYFNAKKWTYIEHTSFWLGLGCAISSFVFRSA